MKLILRNILLTVGLLFTVTVWGGLPRHNELWNRLFISHEFSEKFRVEGEYQFRLQDTPGSNGFPTHRLQQGIRVWGFYKLNPAWTIGISPFCLFRVYPLINTQTDFAAKSATELRFAVNGEWKALISVVELKLRAGYESRHFNKDGVEEWTRKDRMRFRGIVTFPLTSIDSSLSKLSVYAGNEYFIQGQDAFTHDIQFDQNRIIGGIAYKLCAWLKLDVMYMHILRYNAISDYLEQVVWINTTIYL